MKSYTEVLLIGIVLGIVGLLPLIFSLEKNSIRPCPTEDSTNCYWIGDTMGNKQGKSFLEIDGRLFWMEEDKGYSR